MKHQVIHHPALAGTPPGEGNNPALAGAPPGDACMDVGGRAASGTAAEGNNPALPYRDVGGRAASGTKAEAGAPEDLPGLVQAEMARAGLSQADVCREAGVHASLLSAWLAGKYSGDNRRADKALQTWLSYRARGRKARAVLPETPGYVQTAASKRIEAALAYAHMAADVAVIYGGAGMGKTVTIRHYAEANPNVWVLDATPSCNVTGAFLRRLALVVGVQLNRARLDSLELALLDRLRRSHGLLIVDEAQFLAPAALETARRLAELACVGLVLAGNETVYAQLTGRYRAAEFAQLSSRIGKRVRLHRPGEADILALLQAWRLRGKEEQALAVEIGQKPGALRGVTKVIRLASLLAAGEKESLAAKHLRLAFRDLGGAA